MSLSPALTPDEVDAPHVASIVEQFHGAWRDRARAPNSARAFTEAELPRLRAQVFAPRADDDGDDDDAERDAEESAPEDDESISSAVVREADSTVRHSGDSSRGSSDERPKRDELNEEASVGDVPLMRVLAASFASPEFLAPESPAPPAAGGRDAYLPRGTSRATTEAGEVKVVKFALTLSSADFEAGPLEAMRGTVCLVDLGPTEKADAAPHGYRRRLTENVAFGWREGEVGGSSGAAPATAIFELPAASVTLTTRAFVQLTHLAPAAGGLDPKVYTHKTAKEAEKFLSKDRKRLEKLDDASTAFADRGRNPPSAIVAWAVLRITELVDGPGGGVVRLMSGATRAASMFRVKETYAEAQVLDAAAASSHAMKNHKPIRCSLAFEVTPLATREAVEEAASVSSAPTPTLLASDPARGDAPAPAWWEAGGEAEPRTSRRDLFVYVDTTSIGRRKDTRVRVQLREDDLDIDARGSRAVVVAEAGDSSDARSSSSSDEEEEEEATTPSAADAATEDDADAAAPGVPTKKTRPRGRPRRASWSHLSTGKAKGGAWCHEVRVRLPARLNPGHHLVFSVFGRDPEPASSGWGSLGGKVGPEEPLGHAVLPLAAARETLAPDIALAALPMRGSKRLGGAGGAAVPPGAPRRGAAAGESADPSSSSSSGTWVGVNGGIENGHDVSLPAVRDLLPKYMQENVRAHMKYVDDKGKPLVFARLRLRSNVHTADAKIGALYASSAAAAAADELNAAEEFSAHRPVKPTAPGSRSRGGSSLGGASAASRAAVKTATRELCAALRDVHRASAEQLLAHFPAIMHLLLTLIAAPPPAIAAQVAADAALVASAAEARATAARAEAAARLAAANAAATAAKAADVAVGAETKPASSPPPPPPPPPPPRLSPTPDSPASDFSVDTSASSPGTFGVVSASSGSASPSPSPPTAPSPRSRTRVSTPGLVEQAFAALVRVAARTQTLEPDEPSAADFERSSPLEAYAARVFDDARCVADWRGAARSALGGNDAAASGKEKDSKSSSDALLREIPEPLFPRLATLYASRLRKTAQPAQMLESDAAREAADVRRVCWFVLALIARSASLDAARRFQRTERRDFTRGSSDASDDAERAAFSSSTFAAAPSGPATPAPGDARVEALVEMARIVSAETLAPPSASSVSPVDARLRRGMNLGLARLCASLTEVIGPPPGDGASGGSEDDDDDGDDDGDGSVSSRRWWRGGDGISRDETAPLAPLARRVASSHVRRLTSSPAAWPFLYEFCVAACASPRFVAAAAGAARGTGWSPEDLAFERAQEEASALLDAAAAERGGAGEFREDDDESSPTRKETETPSPRPSDALVAAVASATFAGLRSAEDDRRDAAAGALAAILSRHARDASLQSRPARAAVAAVHAPLLRLLVTRRDEIFDAPVPGGAGDASIPAETRRNVLASFLSLARDADQRALWTWLVRDPEISGGDAANDPFFRREKTATTSAIASTLASTNPFSRARALSVAPARRASRPPRLVSFMRLLCDALEAFAFRAEERGDELNDAEGESKRRADASSIVAEGHRSTAVTLVVLELLRRGGRVIAEAQKLEDAFWAKHGGGAARRRGGGGAVGAMFGRGGGESRSERETRAREEARAARAAKKLSPAVTFFEGSLGVLLAAMRAEQSEEAWRALSHFLRAIVWDRRAELLKTATYDPEATKNDGSRESSFFDATEESEIESELENAFPPVPAAPPGATPHFFLESASALLLRAIASSHSKATRTEATSCVRALLEACVDLTGSAVKLRPTLTYALCAALYAPLGAAARRGALAQALISLRETSKPASSFSLSGKYQRATINPRKEKKLREDWEKATRDVLGALESAELKLRALAIAATGPNASRDVETVVDTEIAVARAFAWAPAAHCKALRSLSARLEAGSHWVEAAEAAATAAWTAMRALASATSSNARAACVWREHDARALAEACASLGETFSNEGAFDEKQSAGARCGVEEISEEKVLEHLAEATRLFVKGGHLEAAARVAKTVLPAWERRRAFGDLARAHEGVAGVYRALHAAPPAGAAGSGAFGALPPPPGPPPPPATHYRVRLVGDAWDALGLKGKTWIHREPRDRTLGEMLRRLQTSLTPRDAGEEFPAIAPLPPSGDAGDGACVHVTAVEPVFEASRSWLRRVRSGGSGSAETPPPRVGNDAHGDGLASVGGSGSGSGSTRLDPLVLDDDDDDDDSNARDRVAMDAGGWDGGGFPTARAFVHDAPFTRVSETDSDSVSGPALASNPTVRALRNQWRRRTTSRVAGWFPGLRARLEVTNETVTEMPPCVSTAEMLDAQRRAIGNAADAWELLTRAGALQSSSVLSGVGSAEKSALDDGAARRAAESALSSLQRSLQGSLAAGVNGGVPTIAEAFFPANFEEAPEMSEEEERALVDALEAFVQTCARAVETHGRAARDAAAKANAAAREAKAAKKRGRESRAASEAAAAAAAAAASMERMQGMFVRCAAEVRRDVAAAVARAEERHAAGDGEGSETSA